MALLVATLAVGSSSLLTKKSNMKRDNFRDNGLCALCHEKPHEHEVYHADAMRSFCDDCYQKYYWTCPDCARSFWTGFNKGYKPRHYVELDELDFRFRRKRRECEGWKREGRKAADRRYGWHLTEYPKKAGPIIRDPNDLKRYPKYK
jgi:hypothetical protein